VKERPLEPMHVVDTQRPRRREVSVFRVIWTLLIPNAADQFGDKKVDVGIALPVSVRGQIHGDIGDEDG
jgi:hypothetical protein